MKYRKKPIVIDAILWNGRNSWEVIDFINNETLYLFTEQDTLRINTLEGCMQVNLGDYIIKGVNGDSGKFLVIVYSNRAHEIKSIAGFKQGQ